MTHFKTRESDGSIMSVPVVDFEQMLNNFPVVTMRLSYENKMWKTWYVSKAIEKYGFRCEAFMDGSIGWMDILHPDDRVVILKQAHDYVSMRLDDFRLQYRISTPKGKSVWITEYSHVNRDAEGNVLCVDSILLNTTEAKIHQSSLADHIKQQVVLNDILLSLHDSNLENALQIILDRTGAYLDTSRALLFKDSADHKTCKVLYEWLNKGITSIKDKDYLITYSTGMPEIYVALQETGMLIINAGEIPENCKKEFEYEGLVSSAIFAVYLQGEHYGFVCFDDCVVERKWDEDTVNFLKNISNLISTVLLRMHTEDQLTRSQKVCETVLDNVESYIFVAQVETGLIIFANRAFRKMFDNECIGKHSSEYLPLTIHENEGNDTGNEQYGAEIYLKKTGRWLAVSREFAPWLDGQTVHLVSCYDITAKKQYEENIKRLAYLDHLTGLPNRYSCDADLKRSLESAQRLGQPGYIFFIDMDDFKVVNDCYGHDYGDGVLISFAHYLQELVAGDNHVFRFGGDEFVVVINPGNGTKVEHYLTSLLEQAKSPWKSMDREFYCSLSIGVVEYGSAVEYDSEEETPQSILKKADIAMYHAKKLGKNNYVYYAEELADATLARSTMEALLRSAMKNDFEGFEVHYQPYSDMATRKVIGAEALVRMRDGNNNLLLPKEFIVLAEYLGFIVPIGEHILREAARQCKIINDSGHPDFTITVNLSAIQFKQKDIIPRLEGILRDSGINVSNVIVGINEGVAINELERMLLLSSVLRKRGIKVALDDFGSGSSSFINMRNLTVDIIKVSSEYVDTYEDEFTGYFLKLVTELSHFSGKTVCVNGVETQEQYDFCKAIGIDTVQGFLLHRPGPLEALIEIIG